MSSAFNKSNVKWKSLVLPLIILKWFIHIQVQNVLRDFEVNLMHSFLPTDVLPCNNTLIYLEIFAIYIILTAYVLNNIIHEERYECHFEEYIIIATYKKCIRHIYEIPQYEKV